MRIDLRQQSDTLVLRMLETLEGDFSQKIKQFYLLKEGLYILNVDLWVINKEGSLVASTNDIPLPQKIDFKSLQKSAGTSLTYIQMPSQPALLLGIAKFKKSDFYLLTLQPTSTGVIKQFASYYFIFLGIVFGLTVIVCTILFSFYLRSRVKSVRRIFEKIQAGDLRARIDIKRFDEMSLLAHEFNLIADQMVDLVEKVKASEAGRMSLLKELGHDLRSPIAVLRGLIENLYDYNSVLSAEQELNILRLSKREIESLQSLTEDILFLAQMRESKYRKKSEQVALVKVLEEEVILFNKQISHSGSSKKVTFMSEVRVDRVIFNADGDLLQRAFRNLIENAVRYAHGLVKIVCSSNEHFLKVEIVDDGPGFSSPVLKNFSDLSVSSSPSESFNHNLNGYGLFIAKQVFILHGGDLQIYNQTKGASCQVIIPF